MRCKPSTIILILAAVSVIPALLVRELVIPYGPEIAGYLAVFTWLGVFSSIIDWLAE